VLWTGAPDVQCATGQCPVHHVRTKMNQALSGFESHLEGGGE
jgi:hypothetical protein